MGFWQTIEGTSVGTVLCFLFSAVIVIGMLAFAVRFVTPKK